MSESSSRLYMTQLELDQAGLARLGGRHGSPPHVSDTGHLVHCALAALFGDLAPGPFRVDTARGRWLRVLAYGGHAAEELGHVAGAFATPEAYALCRWDTLAQKQMPEAFPVGSRLGFELRACPVVRMGTKGPHHRKGAEVDAFLAECWRAGEDVTVDRGEVYRRWLSEQLERRGGAVAKCIALARFRRARLVRRTQGSGRKTRTPERPDALLRGELEVLDESDFRSLLARGLGRHRAFGFGMLLLRPPRRGA